ncbi:hypothetical protein LguiB_034568 [Lonicera macranthoides]
MSMETFRRVSFNAYVNAFKQIAIKNFSTYALLSTRAASHPHNLLVANSSSSKGSNSDKHIRLLRMIQYCMLGQNSKEIQNK